MTPATSAAAPTQLRVAIIGCGGMARHHAATMLRHQDVVQIPVVCEPSPDTYRRFGELFVDVGLEAPPNEPDLAALLRDYAGALDAVFIITPHALHHAQAQQAMEAGLDVLLEKPMVMNAVEARNLIAERDRLAKLLVVAFPGSLAPSIRMAANWLRSGEMGKVQSIAGVAYQSWGPGTIGTWRQNPFISGGGFLFDTGAHLLNTVCDLAGEDFAEVSATLAQDEYPVEVRGAVQGRLKSGALVSLHAAGVCPPGVIGSLIDVFAEKAMIRTGIWGERLEVWPERRRACRRSACRGRWAWSTRSWRCGPAGWRTRVRPRSACGWRACMMRLCRRRAAAAHQ